jgi:hypothetical protein
MSVDRMESLTNHGNDMDHTRSAGCERRPHIFCDVALIRGRGTYTMLADGAHEAAPLGSLTRSEPATGELAYYRCRSPAAVPVPLREVVGVAGRRWTIEESFQASKTRTGLDQHQVRRWDSWLPPLDHPRHARLRTPRRPHRN